jgi:hypothetical protein
LSAGEAVKNFKFLAELKLNRWSMLAVVVAACYFWTPLFFHIDDSAMRATYESENEFCQKSLQLLNSDNKIPFIALFSPKVQPELLKTWGNISKGQSSMGKMEAIHLINVEAIDDKVENYVGLKCSLYVDYEKVSEKAVFIIHKTTDSFAIDGFNYSPSNFRFVDTMAFPLTGRSIFQYLYLGAAFGIFLLSAAAFASCAATPNIKMPFKIIWMMAMYVGTISVSAIWVPSPWYGLPLMIGKKFDVSGVNLTIATLFTSGIVKAPIYGPWLIWISIPVGLICYFWIKPYAKKSLNTDSAK